MDEADARQVLAAHLSPLRELSYDQLVERLLGCVETNELYGPSGVRYQLEVQGFWDATPNEVLRVMGAIDDGRGWRANIPLTDDFLIAPDASFVGE